MTAHPAPRVDWLHALGFGLMGASAAGMFVTLLWAAPTIAAWWRAL